jgi:hypothetical protein
MNLKFVIIPASTEKTRRKNFRMPTDPKKMRQYAANAIGLARTSGRLKPEPCCVCPPTKKREAAMAHHEDYSLPLVVAFLCPLHHVHRHMELKNGAPCAIPPEIRALFAHAA